MPVVRRTSGSGPVGAMMMHGCAGAMMMHGCAEPLELQSVVATRRDTDMRVAAKEAALVAVELKDASPEKLQRCQSEVALPLYERSKLEGGVVHIGMGRGCSDFLRSQLLVYLDQLLRQNPEENYRWACTAVGVLPHNDELADALKSQKYLYTLRARFSADAKDNSDLQEDVVTVGSLKDMLLSFREPGEVMRRLASHKTRIISLAVGELAYQDPVSNADTALLQLAASGAEEPWGEADANLNKYLGATALGFITAGLAARRACHAGGATVISFDDLPNNGALLRAKVIERAAAFSDELKTWIEFNCTFPSTVVDRRSLPTRANDIMELAEDHEVADKWPVLCERYNQVVVADEFVEGISGRPHWEEAGIQVVPPEVLSAHGLARGRLYLALQTLLAFPGLLCGLENVSDAIRHPTLRRFATHLLHRELIPGLKGQPGMADVDVEAYAVATLQRLDNVVVSDTLQRWAMDAIAKLTQQVLPAVLDGHAAGQDMRGVAYAVAAWGHFCKRMCKNGGSIPDEMGRLVEAAIEHSHGEDIDQLLGIEPIWHELIFHEGWQTHVRDAYQRIHEIGMSAALDELMTAT